MYGLGLLFITVLILQSTDLVLSALLLAGCFFTTAFWLAAWGFDYVAVVYQLVYLGAVIVLFLFVVMFLDSPGAAEDSVAPTALHSGTLLVPLFGWLLVAFPFLVATLGILGDFFSITLTVDPTSVAVEGTVVDIQDAQFGIQLPIVQYFFSQGASLLFFLGVLFTLALLFALFLILVFAV